jgi:hypothetical protein
MTDIDALIKQLDEQSKDGARDLPPWAKKSMREAAAALRAQQWQPIETAPRNGEFVLYQPEYKSGRMTLGARVCFRGEEGLRETTHWLPLPKAPTT